MPKILYLDIETAPNVCYTWGLWGQNISIEKIKEPGYVLCWAAKWEHEDGLYWAGLNISPKSDMLEGIYYLLNEADFVVHYNGTAFDIPMLNSEFVQVGLTPPAPYKQIDLLRTVQKQFRFPSNKLDYVSQALGVGEKVKHPGFSLWLDCMAGVPSAWKLMERYNKQDVVLLEAVYQRLRPWVPYHPARVLGAEACPACGSERVQRRGTYLAKTRTYQRYCCQSCGSWFRSTESLGEKAEVVSLRA